MDHTNAQIGRMVLAGLFIFLLAAGAWAQAGVTTVKDSGFERHTRPEVGFVHDAHNEKAGIDDCTVCHHMYEDGQKLPYQMSVGMECSECHGSEENNRMELIRVYHQMCRTCHLKNSAGPVQCAQCHTRGADK